MDAIIKFFSSLVDTIAALIDFLCNLIGDLVYVIGLTAEFAANLPTYFTWLPGEVLAIVLSIFGIVVIYKVLGREG